MTFRFNATAKSPSPSLIPLPIDCSDEVIDFASSWKDAWDSCSCSIVFFFNSRSSRADRIKTSSRLAAESGFSRCFKIPFNSPFGL